MRTLIQDLRHGLRQMRKAPGMALLAIVTLALGIGANAAIFTVIESVLLRPLPYAHSDRLVYIGRGTGSDLTSTSWLNYSDIRSQSRLLADVAGYSEDVSVLETRETSQSLAAPHVTANLFSMLGARPLLGRTFTDEEGQTGGPLAVLLSESLWRQSFHADPGIVGQVAKIGGRAYTVVGVMPRIFRFPDTMEPDIQKGVWVALQPTEAMLKDRGYNFFSVVGDLRPGISIAQARQELNAIAAHMPVDSSRGPATFGATFYREMLTGPVRPVLFALFGGLGLVLLIACANVSNLLIGRCLGRQQEFAVRRALGAGRMRLIRQMFTEGLTLSLL
ncbi:MAG TPA: ABC transporter permease, partial [Candidatus Sulfotelmatobacter sp.]|nr:ABC transporter permease [Candidatus Sulfotelmatobacter sp.]